MREHLPQLTDRIDAGIRVNGQHYVDPGWFTKSLARSVVHRGATIRHGFDVRSVRRDGRGFTVRSATGQHVAADTVVLATGAWLPRLGRAHGVAVPVRAGRGCSFTVPTAEPATAPIYLPGIRVACTPYRGGLHVAGTMEFRVPDAALDPARIDAIIESARPLLTGVGWDARTDDWVGSRPVSNDGHPLIGALRDPGLFVAGGHSPKHYASSTPCDDSRAAERL